MIKIIVSNIHFGLKTQQNKTGFSDFLNTMREGALQSLSNTVNKIKSTMRNWRIGESFALRYEDERGYNCTLKIPERMLQNWSIGSILYNSR